jgi:DHA2 family multidrug resistance protein-like MFS transporter
MTNPAQAVQRSREDLIYSRRWLTLGVLSLSLVIIGLDNFVLNVALPTLQDSFSANASQLQWMVDAYILAFAGLLLTMGALGDRFGRARVLQAGLILFGASSIGATFAKTPEQLIAARAIMGFGGAMIMPSTLSILINVFPREERGRAIAAWAGIMGLGIGLGPITGGFLIEHFDWPAVFLINVPVVIAALLFGLVLVPDSRDPGSSAIDLPGAALSISAVTILVYGIIDAPRSGWTDPVILGCFAVAAVLAALFAWRELRSDSPMLDFGLFRNRRMSAGVSAVSAVFFAMFSMIFALTQFLQFVLAQKPLAAGEVMLPLALGIPMGAGLSVRLVARFGSARVVGVALIYVGAVMLTVTQWTASTETWVVALTLFFAALGMANVMAPSVDAILGAVSESRAGVGAAVNLLMGQMAGALGVAVVGSVMNTVYGDRMASTVAKLPAAVGGPAGDSVGAALAVAGHVGGVAGLALAGAARGAFVTALNNGAVVAVCVVAVAGLLVLRFMPPRHLPVEHTER